MKISNWIQLCLVFALIFLGVFKGCRDRELLQTYSNTTSAVIIDKYRIKSRGYFIKYRYSANDVKHESSESLKKRKEVDSFFIGDTIKIEYSCTHPNISKFKLDQ